MVREAKMPPETDTRGSLSNLIRRLRFERGEMTQQELAQRVGVTRQTIIALEAGRYVPSLLLAFRLARAFGVGLEAVFQYHEAEPGIEGKNAQDVKK
jgi:putative transcriptional regulator